MASSSTQPPSSSSSSLTSRGKHDVFLSFYGQYILKDFTDCLYAALKRKGILTFPRGKYCSEELLKAIQQSTYAVVVISRNYASSKRCLIELTEILQCVRKTELTILPVFYHVDPRDVRNQKGIFAEAFAKHEHDPQIAVEKIQLWKAALKQVGYICGWDVKERYETSVVEEITAEISRQLQYSTPSRVYCSNLVGIDTSVQEIMSLLSEKWSDVRFIGISGVGGIGKTTLAEFIYHRVSHQFEVCSFISSIRENSGKHGLVSLQKQLASEILNAKKMHIEDIHEGINVIVPRMQNRKILIVLDDVDATIQLEALAGSHDWFGQGSRIIVTSRDSDLLEDLMDDLYEIEVLNNNEALKLFSLSAFNKPHPHKDYVDLSKGFVNYAQGLPLALKVLGSSLSNRTTDSWKNAFDQLKANPRKEILDVLEIGFVGLENMQKKLFLDIACFFEGEVLDNVLMDTLESFGYHSHDIEVLMDKSLITRRFGKFGMHDLLQEMGKEIVQRESPMEPGQRSRLWQYEDVLHVLKNNTGTNAIEGIVLQLPLDKEERFSIGGFKKMKNLRILKLDKIILAENLWDKLCAMIRHRHPLESIPTKELCIMKWDGYPLECLPINFEANNLVELSIHGRDIKELWKGTKSFGSLKRLDLGQCSSLIKTPDFTKIPNLEFLDLSDCASLSQIHQSIGVLKWLKELHLRCCISLKSVAPDMTGLESLEVLTLSQCLELEKIPVTVGMTSLQQLHLDYTFLKEFPPFSNLSSLFHLNLEGCSRLEDFPNLSGLKHLAVFNANDTAITKFPSPHLLPKNWEKIKVLGRIDLPAESGEFLWFNNSPAPYEDDDHIIKRIFYGHKKIDCRRNFLEGFYVKKGSDILYFGLGAHQDQRWRFVKGRCIFDFIMTGASLATSVSRSRISNWYFYNKNSEVQIDFTAYMDNPKLKGYCLFFVFEIHGPDWDTQKFHPREAPLLPCGIIFESYKGFRTKSLFLWAPRVPNVGPIEFWAFVPTTWFLKHPNNWDTRNASIKASVTFYDKKPNYDPTKRDVKYTIPSVEEKYIPTKSDMSVTDCKVQLVYEDDASQFYSSVAPHGLHSQYYEHPCYHPKEMDSDEETDSDELLDHRVDAVSLRPQMLPTT